MTRAVTLVLQKKDRAECTELGGLEGITNLLKADRFRPVLLGMITASIQACLLNRTTRVLACPGANHECKVSLLQSPMDCWRVRGLEWGPLEEANLNIRFHVLGIDCRGITQGNRFIQSIAQNLRCSGFRLSRKGTVQRCALMPILARPAIAEVVRSRGRAWLGV